MGHLARALVDLDAITHNLAALKTDKERMVIVKAGAYGHGLEPVSAHLWDLGIRWFGVAQLSEALQLRQTLPEARILSWIFRGGPDVEAAISRNISLSVSDLAGLRTIEDAASRVGVRPRIHLKIDTGMSRAGAPVAKWPALCRYAHEAAARGNIEVEGVWSHLSSADTRAGRALTVAAFAEFRAALETAKNAGIQPKWQHLGASAGALWHQDLPGNMVRLGIAVYGLSPEPTTQTEDEMGIIPALSLETELMLVKKVAGGRPVSYGATWVTPSERYLGIVPVGYADGIHRLASGKARVLVITEDGPVSVPQVGRICMDQFVVDLGENTGAKAGDKVVVFGPGTRGEPTVNEWAHWADTINYEILTAVGPRVPRIPLRQNQNPSARFG
ncbi:MAG: alanine racemase [Actinomycetaceae bacterium]|nr:alanine racemase [Actinomycetaceae bacterium]